jgi:hypothetical protein
MRRNPFTGVFNEAYNNQAVRFNVQDAYLENDITDERLTRAFTHLAFDATLALQKKSTER